jgi:hypothetical protein
MIKIKSNISGVMRNVSSHMDALANTQDMLRYVATNMIPEIRHRIHVEGKATDGNQIGTYSPGYLKLRTEGYKSETITRGKGKGNPRTVQSLNRESDSKVIISATRQLENDYAVIPTARGYGIGFKNPENAKKAEYCEETYNKPIFPMTSGEQQKAVALAVDYINRNRVNG